MLVLRPGSQFDAPAREKASRTRTQGARVLEKYEGNRRRSLARTALQPPGARDDFRDGALGEREEYAHVVELVPLTVVNNEMEAEVLCGELRAAGIECGHRPATSAGMGTAFMGPHEVLVKPDDLESANELLSRDE
jgi:hypothetical protein